MESADPSSEKKEPTRYNKVIANIPDGLLQEFDKVCDALYYSRAEGVKQAMRDFIVNSMPDDYVPPQLTKLYRQQVKDVFAGMGEGLAELANDPKIQELQKQANPTPPFSNTQTLPSPNSSKGKKSKNKIKN